MGIDTAVASAVAWVMTAVSRVIVALVGVALLSLCEAQNDAAAGSEAGRPGPVEQPEKGQELASEISQLDLMLGAFSDTEADAEGGDGSDTGSDIIKAVEIIPEPITTGKSDVLLGDTDSDIGEKETDVGDGTDTGSDVSLAGTDSDLGEKETDVGDGTDTGSDTSSADTDSSLGPDTDTGDGTDTASDVTLADTDSDLGEKETDIGDGTDTGSD